MVVFAGTLIVRLRFTLLLKVSLTIEALRVPVGPPGGEFTVRVTLPWKKFRLCRFSTIVVLEPGRILTELGVAVMVKSVAARVITIWCESAPSLAITVIR